MALTTERKIQDSHMGLIQTCSFHNFEFFDPSSFGFYSSMENQKQVLEEGYCTEKSGGLNFLPSSSFDPSGLSSSGFMFERSDSGFCNWAYSSGSILDFKQGGRVHQSATASPEGGSSVWIESVGKNDWNSLTDSRLGEDANCIETSSGCGAMDYKHGDERLKWLYSDGRAGDYLGEDLECNSGHKRPYMGGGTASVQATKKHCTTVPRKPKPKTIPSKDPQSIAAKNRRERISERLKILQNLVPNGTKVDLVTMLEKAISYVKFLQLQVKVLATDEFWPVQGGKAPEVAQVKEAIDAILSSHRGTKTARESAADS